MTVQTQYDRYSQAGYAGDLARPNEPFAFDHGVAHVPDGTRNPRPGDAVYYDAANGGWRLPTDTATPQLVSGIVSYDPGTVASHLPSTPDGAQNDSFIEYASGSDLKIGVFGTFWAVAGSPAVYGQRMTWQTDDQLWDAADTAAAATEKSGAVNLAMVNALVDEVNALTLQSPFICVSPKTVGANELVQIRIGIRR